MLTAIHVTLIIQYDVISTVDSNEPVRMHVFRICHKRPINFLMTSTVMNHLMMTWYFGRVFTGRFEFYCIFGVTFNQFTTR